MDDPAKGDGEENGRFLAICHMTMFPKSVNIETWKTVTQRAWCSQAEAILFLGEDVNKLL